jgi:alpha-tubulin suppressor-like RCC1 family protein
MRAPTSVLKTWSELRQAVWRWGLFPPPVGDVFTFGRNYFGQLGHWTPSTGFHTRTNVPTPFFGQLGHVIHIAAGFDHSLVVSADRGELFVFGNNRYGQLGIMSNSGSDYWNWPPAVVPNFGQWSGPGHAGRATQVAAGQDHSLVVAASGQLWAFGGNHLGQLGNATYHPPGDANPVPTPVTLPGQSGQVTQVAAGFFNSLAATSGGQLYAFGRNDSGQNGSAANTGPNPTPGLVTLPGQVGGVRQIAAGNDHTLVVTSGGQLYAFGSDAVGQAGLRTGARVNPVPTLVVLPGQAGQVTQVAASNFHSLVVTSSGQLYAFGWNTHGQLGTTTNIGTYNANPVPTLVTLPGQTGPVAQVAAGQDHSLAVTANGQLFAFGSNDWGQLGVAANRGTTAANPVPALVALGVAIGTVAPGPASHSLALVSGLEITSASLPSGSATLAYAATPSAAGTPPLTWSASALPAGLSIDARSGVIAGIPTAAGTSSVTITVGDTYGSRASRWYELTITPPP